MSQAIRQFASDERGAAAIEYGLIASLIALAFVVGATALGSQINNTFNSAAKLRANALP